MNRLRELISSCHVSVDLAAGVSVYRVGGKYSKIRHSCAPCHGFVKQLPRQSLSKFFNVILRSAVCEAREDLPEGFYNRDVSLEYLDWLQNKSPYAEVFLTKNPVTALDSFQEINLNAPRNLLMGGLQASRRIWESRITVVAWKALCDEGVHPDLAFMAGHTCYRINGGKKNAYILRRVDSHHYPFSTRFFSDGSIRNFLKRSPKNGVMPFKESKEDNTLEGWGLEITFANTVINMRWEEGLRDTVERIINLYCHRYDFNEWGEVKTYTLRGAPTIEAWAKAYAPFLKRIQKEVLGE